MTGLSSKLAPRRASTRAAPLGRGPLALGLTVFACVGLGACADVHRALYLPPVNPESPVATAVDEALQRTYPRPALADVPPAPKNVPSAPQVKVAVIGMVRCRRTFEGYVAVHPQPVSDTAQFAELERAKVDTDPADVPTAQDAAGSESYAEQLRAYAAPPAPIPAGPPPTAAEGMPPGTAPPPSPSPPRPAAVAERRPAPVGPSAAPPVTVASAEPMAIEPPLPPAGADPLLAHCR